MHEGQDSEFYLKKGFKVVGVEADAELCSQAASRFADAVRDERLVIVNDGGGGDGGRADLLPLP